jgi:hypothetical protein
MTFRRLNWACKVRDILFKYGFHNIWISQYVNHVDFFMCEFKQRMKENFISEMNTFSGGRSPPEALGFEELQTFI